MGWKETHDKDFKVPSAIDENYVDISYKNDIMPRFGICELDDNVSVTLWVDYPNKGDREDARSYRYSIIYNNYYKDFHCPLYETESLQEVLYFIGLGFDADDLYNKALNYDLYGTLTAPQEKEKGTMKTTITIPRIGEVTIEQENPTAYCNITLHDKLTFPYSLKHIKNGSYDAIEIEHKERKAQEKLFSKYSLALLHISKAQCSIDKLPKLAEALQDGLNRINMAIHNAKAQIDKDIEKEEKQLKKQRDAFSVLMEQYGEESKDAQELERISFFEDLHTNLTAFHEKGFTECFNEVVAMLPKDKTYYGAFCNEYSNWNVDKHCHSNVTLKNIMINILCDELKPKNEDEE